MPLPPLPAPTAFRLPALPTQSAPAAPTPTAPATTAPATPRAPFPPAIVLPSRAASTVPVPTPMQAALTSSPLIKIGTRTKLGSTEMGDIDRCERLFWYKHVRNLTHRAAPRARMLGTLFHICMRYWYAQFMRTPPAWFAKDMNTELAEQGRGHPDLINQAKRILFEGYVPQFGDVDRAWEIIDVEAEYHVPLTTLEREGAFAGQPAHLVEAVFAAGECPTLGVDFHGRRPGDRVEHIIDYKSTQGYHGKLGAWNEHANRYLLGWQPLSYQWMASRAVKQDGSPAFENVGGFLIQRILSDPPFDADRHDVKFSPVVMREVPRLIGARLIKRHLLLESIRNGYEPLPAYGEACESYGGCDFAQVCRSTDREDVLTQRYVANPR